MAQKFPDILQHLIAYLRKLPGVGTRTAERFAFELLSWPEEELASLGKTFIELRTKVFPCAACGCLTHENGCPFCDSKTRDASQLCIIASPRDAYSIEETKTYRGLYHVVEHLLSPIDGRHAHEIKLDRIEERIKQRGTTEIIIAFDSTLEGDTTALYFKKHFSRAGLNLSRLAFGLPVGSSLEYIDGGTLTRALQGRQTF